MPPLLRAEVADAQRVRDELEELRSKADQVGFW